MAKKGTRQHTRLRNKNAEPDIFVGDRHKIAEGVYICFVKGNRSPDDVWAMLEVDGEMRAQFSVVKTVFLLASGNYQNEERIHGESPEWPHYQGGEFFFQALESAIMGDWEEAYDIYVNLYKDRYP